MTNSLATLLALALTLPRTDALAPVPAISANVESGAIAAAAAGTIGTGAASDAGTMPIPALPGGGRMAGLGATEAMVPPVASGSDNGSNTLLAMKALSPTAFIQMEPLLTVLDIWDWGEIGTLRRLAYAAVRNGDDAAYRAYAAKFWERLGVAIERRKTMGTESVPRTRRPLLWRKSGSAER